MIARHKAATKKPLSEFLTRLFLALEELAEWSDAHANQDLVAAMDAWGDRIYVLIGDAVAAGYDAEKIFESVHHSNMTKTAGRTSSTGKAIKGSNFQPPHLDKLK